MINLLDGSRINYALHWGKNGPWSKKLVKKMYGTKISNWKTQRNKLINKPMREILENRYSDKIGLS